MARQTFLWRKKKHYQAEDKRPALYEYTCHSKITAVPTPPRKAAGPVRSIRGLKVMKGGMQKPLAGSVHSSLQAQTGFLATIKPW